MNTFQTCSDFLGKILKPALISDDFIIVCLWATVGSALTMLAFTCGFGAEVGQALAVAG
jgi:hypothetical protein